MLLERLAGQPVARVLAGQLSRKLEGSQHLALHEWLAGRLATHLPGELVLQCLAQNSARAIKGAATRTGPADYLAMRSEVLISGTHSPLKAEKVRKERRKEEKKM